MNNKKVTYNHYIWEEEQTENGMIRLVRWGNKDGVRYIEDVVELALPVYADFLKRGWIIYE